jgi:hypothetical protein
MLDDPVLDLEMALLSLLMLVMVVDNHLLRQKVAKFSGNQITLVELEKKEPEQKLSPVDKYLHQFDSKAKPEEKPVEEPKPEPVQETAIVEKKPDEKPFSMEEFVKNA